MNSQNSKPIYVPYVYERTSRGERYFDLFSRLQNATIQLIEIKHGLPFKALVEEDAA